MMGWIRTGVDEACALQARQPAPLVLAVAGTLGLGWMRFLGPQDSDRKE